MSPEEHLRLANLLNSLERKYQIRWIRTAPRYKALELYTSNLESLLSTLEVPVATDLNRVSGQTLNPDTGNLISCISRTRPGTSYSQKYNCLTIMGELQDPHSSHNDQVELFQQEWRQLVGGYSVRFHGSTHFCWVLETVMLYNVKINVRGDYLPYPGLTVLSMASNDSKMIQLHQALTSSELAMYYSFLPTASYHVTVCNLFTKDLIPDYQTHILRLLPTLRSLDLRLGQIRNLDCQITSPYLNSTIGLLIAFPKSATILAQMREEIQTQLGVDDRGLVFHLTLAYRYRDIKPHQYIGLTRTLKYLAGEILDIDHYLQLETPGVYQFNSMESFCRLKTINSPDRH